MLEGHALASVSGFDTRALRLVHGTTGRIVPANRLLVDIC